MRTLRVLLSVTSVLLIHFSLASNLEQQVFNGILNTVKGDGGTLDMTEQNAQNNILIGRDLPNKVVSKSEKFPVVQFQQTGLASWYGKSFHGKRTASGELYSMYKMTAAHKKIPLNTKIRVTNLKNNRSVIVKINDRGPYVKNRILDVSYAAAKELGFVSTGVAKVKIEVLKFLI